MEAVQQDKDPLAQPGTYGELDLANDGHESEAQRTDASHVCHSGTLSLSVLSLIHVLQVAAEQASIIQRHWADAQTNGRLQWNRTRSHES